MKKTLLISFISLSLSAFSQDEVVSQTFKDTRVVNGHSVEMNKEGQMKMIISHRFGALDGGASELYGLDQAHIRLGLDYGIMDWLNVGIGRSSTEKTVDGFVKARLVQQKNNSTPVSINWISSAAVNTFEDFANGEAPSRARWAYTNQLLIARKFSDRFALQIMPSHLHKNLVPTREDENDIFSVGTAGRYQLTKLVSFKAEYYYTFDGQLPDEINNTLSLGFDIETKHHVFQLNLSNSKGMIEKFFIGDTRGDWDFDVSSLDSQKWDLGDVMFGFNITRDFQVKGKKYK